MSTYKEELELVHEGIIPQLEKLAENRHKKHWKDINLPDLYDLLQDELWELNRAIADDKTKCIDPELYWLNIMYEIADSKNFLDMLLFHVKRQMEGN